MYQQQAYEEYLIALKNAQKGIKSAGAKKKLAQLIVLDELPEITGNENTQYVGILEIPTERIIGVKSAGRVAAFNGDFMPLLGENTEFAIKWIQLCAAHLEEGIREPIVCFEYLGNFYVQEGNKRVSVLKHFGAARIPAVVTRILPAPSEEPRYVAYQEFLEFFKNTGLYQIQFRNPGDYALLVARMGKEPDAVWTEYDRRNFIAGYQYFKEAFLPLQEQFEDLLVEEALLLWLQVYPYSDLLALSASQLKKTVRALKEDMLAISQAQPVEVRTEAVSTEGNLLSRFLSSAPEHVNVAFIHPQDPKTSEWSMGHDEGRKHLESELGDKVTTRSYFHANTPEVAEELMEKAVAEGADVVFTTTPQLSRSTLRMAVKYPKVRFLNCSVDAPYSSVRTYYGRIYEAKFITGAIAGAMANDDKIGYIGANPIFGVPASINAFALGAQMTNPRAKVCLRWTCLPGSPQTDFIKAGIRVFSNKDVAATEKAHYNFCNYGTYQLNEGDVLEPLASPLWVWGEFYETVVRSILAGTFDKDKNSPRALNYWWGMDSGVIDVALAETMPEGVAALAQLLRKSIQDGTLDPFHRRIVDQQGNVRNDGSRSFSAEELLHMDWLCENVEGTIPEFEEIEPFAQPIVRELGVHRNRIPAEKE